MPDEFNLFQTPSQSTGPNWPLRWSWHVDPGPTVFSPSLPPSLLPIALCHWGVFGWVQDLDESILANQIARMTQPWKLTTTAGSTELQISKANMKVMNISNNINARNLERKALEELHTRTYLGSIVVKDRGSDKNIHVTIWKPKNKLNSNVKSVLFYVNKNIVEGSREDSPTLNQLEKVHGWLNANVLMGWSHMDEVKSRRGILNILWWGLLPPSPTQLYGNNKAILIVFAHREQLPSVLLLT